MTILAIIVAATIGLVVGVNLGYATALVTIRRSGYVVERVPDSRPTRCRIGVRHDAAPVVPAVEWIASARISVVTPAGSLGHAPRGKGRE